MSPHTTAGRITIALMTSFLILSVSGPGLAQEDELQRIEELRECIDRTDPERGQNPAWRAEKCPLDEEAAQAELAELLEKVKEKTEKSLRPAKDDLERKAGGAKGSLDDEGGSSTKQRKAGASVAPASLTLPTLPSLLGAGGPSLAGLRELGALPGLCQVTGAPSLTFGSLPTFGSFGTALPTLGTGAPQTGFNPSGTSVECDLSRVLPPMQVPASEHELVSPLLDIEKVALDVDDNPITQVQPGQTFKYVITITNGLMEAALLNVQDNLPAEFTYGTPTTTMDCSASTGTMLNCSESVPAGESRTITIGAALTSEFCLEAQVPITLVPNLAELFFIPPIEGPAVLSDADTATVAISCTPLLEVTKTAVSLNPDGSFQSGDLFLYTINLQNGTQDDVEGRIRDDLPDELEPIQLLAGGWDCSATAGDVIDCRKTILADDSDGIVVLMGIPEEYCNDVDGSPNVPNLAEAYTPIEPVGDVLVDTDTERLAVACSSLHIDKDLDPQTVLTGQTVSFPILVLNDSPLERIPVGRATGVVIEDVLPPGFEFLGDDQDLCSLVGGNVVCEVGTLERGEDFEIDLFARPTNEAPCGAFTNKATVSALNEYLIHEAEDNKAKVSGTHECVPNLTITKTADAVGRDITYTITARNTGTETATGVIVTDDLDNALNQVEASASQGTCVVGAGNSVACEIGDIPVDGSETVTITARAGVAACPSVVNEAEGTAVNEPEEAQGDNSDRVRITVDCVLGSTTTRGGAVLGSLAATGLGLLPLLLLAGILLGAGEVARRAGKERRRRKHA